MGNAIGGGGLLVHGAGEESAEVEEGGTMVADIVDSMEGRPGADQTPPPRVAGGKNSQHRRRRRRSHSMGLSPPSLDYVDADEGESPTSSTLTKSMSFSGGPAGLSSFYEVRARYDSSSSLEDTYGRLLCHSLSVAILLGKENWYRILQHGVYSR
jgi:ribosomal protein L32